MRVQRSGMSVLLFVLVTAVLAATHRSADPAAVVVQLTGKVDVQRGARTLPAAVGTALEGGDRLVVATGGRAMLMYRTGKMENATASVTIEDRQSDQPAGLYRQTVQTITQVATTDAAKQPNRQGMIRPVPGEATPISPRNSIRVLDVRPAFTWFAAPSAQSYTIQLRRTDVPGSLPVRFEARDTVWTYPATEPPLVPGATYQWTISAGATGRVAPLQTFRVVGETEFATLSAMFAELAAAGVDPAADGQFVTALWYREAGLFYEADRVLTRMAGSGAGTGRVFHLLRGEVLDRLGDLEGASLAFRAADAEPGS